MNRTASARPPRTAAPRRLPSGPPGHPILGVANEMRGKSLGFLLDTMRTYGDVAAYRVLHLRIYLVTHPDLVKYVLQDNYRNYNKNTFSFGLLRSILGDGLLTMDGESWLRDRRLMQPMFHRQRIAGFGDLMTRATQSMLGRWAARPDPRGPLDIADELMALTLNIVSQALFSASVESDANAVGESMNTLLEDIIYRFSMPFYPPPSIPTPRNRRFRRAVATLDEVVLRIIANRRRRPDQADDLLGMLLAAHDEDTGAGMSDAQIRNEVLTLMLAGHETTATALSWTFYLLSQHPTVAARLRAELADVLGGRTPSVHDLPRLVYTRQVIEEAMRLYPPAWITQRRAVHDDELGGFHIPAGTMVSLSPYAVHHRPDFWENPAGFDPDRFSPERAAGRHRFAYFPFGGGPHLCIGNSFAMVEAQLVLATIAQRYRLDLVPGHPVIPEPLITLRPKHGLLMTLHRL